MSALSNEYWKRTHTCGELTGENTDQEVLLCGWVNTRRDHGGLIFIDLRDRYGITQVVIDPAQEAQEKGNNNNLNNPNNLLDRGSEIRNEFVLSVRGVVRGRPANMVNSKLKTGEIELLVKDLTLLSRAETPPFVVEDDVDASETLRLKHRYLDLRRSTMQRNLFVRSQFIQITREYLAGENFMDIETPILFKSTPEGARDYLVPSRVNPGAFYALPQSPQILKQLLMISGMDRYYQIARCFRDEDLRADRQPEFSQIDIELSFTDEETIFALLEGLMKRAYKEILNMDIPTPFNRLTYKEAMENYGVDKPDTRFELKLQDAGEIFANTGFNAFKSVLSSGGRIKGICVKGAAEGNAAFSRKDFDQYTKYVSNFGAKGLAWLKVIKTGPETELNSPIAKFLSQKEQVALTKTFSANAGDVIFIIADKDPDVVFAGLGALRLQIGRDRGLIDQSAFHFHWVTEFPMFEYSVEEKRYVAKHHPFTQPLDEDREKFLKDEDLPKLRAAAYDLVLNGHEVAGGSLRIHEPDIQAAMFRALNMSEDQIQSQFGFFMEALKYGTPPHGGIAVGIERNIMILVGTEAIRDVMAFPKTQKASCLMSNCPSVTAPEQLAELQISLLKQKPGSSQRSDMMKLKN